MSKITDTDLRQIVSLIEMSVRGSQEGADAHIKNEGTNAVLALLRLLGKYGLSFSDIPELQRQHAAKATAKTAAPAAAGGTTQRSTDPNILDLTHHMFQGYIDVQPHEYVGMTLWALHTQVFAKFQITPRLAALSPLPGCGKSKLLKLLEKLTANPERHDGITAASLFRLIENAATFPPTLLLDEGDNLGLKIDRVMRQVLNSGWMEGGVITRTIRNQPVSFSTFAPAAIGAIGALTRPLMQRSIVIQMHKSARKDLKTFEDMVTPEETQRFEALRQLIVSWAAGVTLDPGPSLPKILRGRTADNWRVLISIADSFGNAHWSKAAREAATAFANGYYDEHACEALLYDIRTIFRREAIDRIKSGVLVAMLYELEEGVGIWSAWRGEADDQVPHPITQGEVAMLLRRFDRNLRPKTLVGLGSHETRGKAARGYYKHQFEKWWQLYCTEDVDEDAAADNVQQLHYEAKR